MSLVNHHGGVIIVASIIAGWILTLIPIGDTLLWARPDITGLILVYWVLALPQRVGMLVAWISGLCLDVLVGTPLGLNGLCYTLLAYFFQRLHQRIRLMPIWQHTLLILLVFSMAQLIRLWVEKLAGTAIPIWAYSLPAITSTCLWPAIFLALRYLRRHFEVR